MTKFLRSHLVLVFFVLTFLLSWSIWIPLALDHFSLLPIKLDQNFVMVVRLFGTLGPAVSAILVSLFTGGKPAVKTLLGQIGRWRIPGIWFAAAGLVFPILIILSAWLYRLLPGAAPIPVPPVSLAGILVTVIVMTISVLGEEIGWRGFALPKMQEKWPALASSLVLAAIWTVWHLPFWALLDELARFGWGYWLMGWAFITAGTIYITWMMNNTRNSLLLAILFHWTFNILSAVFLPITTIIPAYLILIGFSWSIALVLIGIFGSQRLVRAQTAAA